MKKVLITGITGFAGSHLAEYLLSLGGYDISGTYLTDGSLSTVVDIKDRLNLVKLDLLSSNAVLDLFSSSSFDIIFHLAAISAPSKSFDKPGEILHNNIQAQLNILEVLKKQKSDKTRMILVSSGEVYGDVEKSDLPIDEKTYFRPVNPYAISKLTQDLLGFSYFFLYDLDIIRVRPFNHIGPRQSPAFVVSAFSKQIAEIEKGMHEPVVKVGNLEARRDFCDARDMVRAYVFLSEKGGKGDVYNAGSGVSYKIGDILLKLLSLSKVKIKIEQDTDLIRPSDIPNVVCDSSKLRNLTGWKCEIPLEISLKDTLDYWRQIL